MITGAAIAPALRQFLLLHNVRTFIKRGDALEAAQQAFRLGYRERQRLENAEHSQPGNQAKRAKKQRRIQKAAEHYNFLSKSRPRRSAASLFNSILHDLNELGKKEPEYRMSARTLQDCLAKARKQGLILATKRQG